MSLNVSGSSVDQIIAQLKLDARDAKNLKDFFMKNPQVRIKDNNAPSFFNLYTQDQFVGGVEDAALFEKKYQATQPQFYTLFDVAQRLALFKSKTERASSVPGLTSSSPITSVPPPFSGAENYFITALKIFSTEQLVRMRKFIEEAPSLSLRDRIKRWNDLEIARSNLTSRAESYLDLHPNKVFQNACNELIDLLDDSLSPLNPSEVESVYQIIKGMNEPIPSNPLTPEEQKAVKVWWQKLEDRGIHLPPSQRRRVITLQEEIDKVKREYSILLSESEKTIFVKIPIPLFESLRIPNPLKEELKTKGIVEGNFLVFNVRNPLLEQLSLKGGGKRIGEFTELYQRAQSEIGYPKNLGLIRKIAFLTDSLAKLLGYKNAAEYQMRELSIKTPGEAEKIFDRLFDHPKLKARADAELKHLKASYETEFGQKAAEKIPAYLSHFLERGYIERQTSGFSSEKWHSYRRRKPIVEGYIHFLRYSMEYQVEENSLAEMAPGLNLISWDDQVQSLKLTDDQQRVDYRFLDLYRRENKPYNRGFALYLQEGVKGIQPPLSVLMMNLEKGFDLMTDDHLFVLLHEGSHLFHFAHSGRVASLLPASGTSSVPKDIVEALGDVGKILQYPFYIRYGQNERGEKLSENKALIAAEKASRKAEFRALRFLQSASDSELYLDIFSRDPKTLTDEKLVSIAQEQYERRVPYLDNPYAGKKFFNSVYPTYGAVNFRYVLFDFIRENIRTKLQEMADQKAKGDLLDPRVMREYKKLLEQVPIEGWLIDWLGGKEKTYSPDGFIVNRFVKFEDS